MAQIALAGSRRLRATLAAAPVLFALKFPKSNRMITSITHQYESLAKDVKRKLSPLFLQELLNQRLRAHTHAPTGRVRHSVAIFGQLLLFSDQSMREKALRQARPSSTRTFSANRAIILLILATVTTACVKRAGAATRESHRRDRPSRLTSPAFHACGSASP
jgi:hypothetical protein